MKNECNGSLVEREKSLRLEERLCSYVHRGLE